MLSFVKDICCRVMSLLSIALKILPLTAATQQTGPYFQSCGEGFCCRGWRTEKNDTRQKCILVIHKSNTRQDLPTRSPASPAFSQQCSCAIQRAGACTTPQRHAFLNCKHMCAPSPASFPHPQCSGGNSCRMLPVIHLILFKFY